MTKTHRLENSHNVPKYYIHTYTTYYYINPIWKPTVMMRYLPILQKKILKTRSHSPAKKSILYSSIVPAVQSF